MLFAGVQRVARRLFIGDVAGNLGKADQLGAVEHRVDHDAGPEARPVLAHAPAFAFELAFETRGQQCGGGDAAGLVFRRVEAREMLADDLVCLVALEALGAGVPGTDPTFGVEQVDGVIADARNEQLLALLEAEGRNLIGHRPLLVVIGRK